MCGRVTAFAPVLVGEPPLNLDVRRQIDATTVQRHQLQGYITAGATPGYETLEVLFESKEAPTGGDVRTYRLAADGSKLLELRAGKVVETRTKCAATQK